MFCGGDVAAEAHAGEALAACLTGVGDLAEILAGVDVAEVHLDGGDADGLERVENGDAGVGVGGGVYDDAVDALICALDGVDYRALVVGLEELAVDAELGAAGADLVDEVEIGAPAVNLRLAYAEKVDVGAVYNEETHVKSPCFQIF